MKMNFKIIRFCVALWAAIGYTNTFLYCQDDSAEAMQIVNTMDELYRSQSSYAEVRMRIVNPHWERTLTMKTWTKGRNKTFITILSPAREKGVSTLRVENEMWNYLPKTNKIIKVPPSMMMSAWMGSDFNNDDLVSEFTFRDDYTFSIVSRDSSRITLKCIPKEGRAIVWGQVQLVVRSDDYLPVEEKYFDEKGNLMRVMTFKQIKTFDHRKIPTIMELTPQNKADHQTVLEYIELKLDYPVTDRIFSLQNLRSAE
jgi:outer membrane lipoprotein-sorting protein